MNTATLNYLLLILKVDTRVWMMPTTAIVWHSEDTVIRWEEGWKDHLAWTSSWSVANEVLHRGGHYVWANVLGRSCM